MYKIGIDVDECLNELMLISLNILNERTGKKYTKSDFHEYGIHKCIPTLDADLLMEIFEDKEAWDKMLPQSDAQMAVKKLVSAGHQVYFVSACSPTTHRWKSDFLNKVFSFVPENRHLYIHEKQLLTGLDILVDDNPNNLMGGAYTRIIFDQPWNRNCSEAFYEYRVMNMSEVVDVIEKMMEKEYED